MAKPIKETPILKGKDAEVFKKRVEENRQIKVSPVEKRRIEEENYHSLKRTSSYQ